MKRMKPSKKEAVWLSFSKIMQYLDCPRCFYVDRKEGVRLPKQPFLAWLPLIHRLIMDEFNEYRKERKKHPLFIRNNIDAVFYDNKKLLNKWTNLPGITYFDKKNKLKFMGLIDDLLLSSQRRLIIIDFKFSSSVANNEYNLDRYAKQISFYNWLLEKNGYRLEDYGYILRIFFKKSKKVFEKGLFLDSKFIKVRISYGWLERAITDIIKCLNKDYPPEPSDDCDLCNFSRYKFNDISQVINEGESNRREFKSSLRWDYKKNRINPELEHAIAKTISSFMNTEGGELIVGVSDEGKVLGIQKDIKTLSKKSKDSFAIRLGQIVDKYLGKESNNYLIHEFRKRGEKIICLIKVEKSIKGPIYCGDEFYIRSVAQTQKCTPKEAGEYIRKHWGNIEN